jgi:hypothetical protein
VVCRPSAHLVAGAGAIAAQTPGFVVRLVSPDEASLATMGVVRNRGGKLLGRR